MKSSILVVDDDPSILDLVEARLKKREHAVTTESTVDAALECLRRQDFDLVITDLQIGTDSGLAISEWVSTNRPGTPVIVITAFGSMETAVGAIRAGADDFVTKPVDLELLDHIVERAIQRRRLTAEVERLRATVARAGMPAGIIGKSSAMKKLADLIDRIGDSDASVLITGQSGTGKELVARALHDRSTRKDGAFVPVNCAALPENLLESELFGHVKGAFTDARTAKDGLFRRAGGGTLFLDEIAETAPEMQVKLLRALQERKVRPVGGTEEIAFDTRIVAATNRDIESDVEEGRFREDLYYRINVVRLRVPPLRARGNDVLLLAQHFIDRIAARSGKNVRGIAAPAAQMLVNYDWPGNVRELENTIERGMALARFEEITADDLPEKIRDHQSTHVVVAGANPDELLPLEEVEQRYIMRVLAAVDGNKTEAARILDVDRRTLYRKLERYERYERQESND